MAYIAQWQLKFGERTLQPGDRVKQSDMDSLPAHIRESLLEQHKIVEVEQPAPAAKLRPTEAAKKG